MVFAAAVAAGIFVIATRLSDDAIAIIIGFVLAGTLAVIFGILLVAITRGRKPDLEKPREPSQERYQVAAPPPQIYIVSPGQMPHQLEDQLAPAPPLSYYRSRENRQYLIAGEDF